MEESELYQSIVRKFSIRGGLAALGPAAVLYPLNDNNIKSVTIKRQGQNNKFIGVLISQVLTINLLDKERRLDINTGDIISELDIGITDRIDETRYKSTELLKDYIITKVERNENTNELTITANDAFEKAKTIKIKEIHLPVTYTLRHCIELIADWLDLGVDFTAADNNILDLNYPDGANLSGEESLYDVLVAASEILYSYMYIDANKKVVIHSLTNQEEPYVINKDNYFTLKQDDIKNLHKIIVGNSLGDSIYMETDEPGDTQFIRDNPFIDNRDDREQILSTIINNAGNLKYVPVDISWRGNATVSISNRIKIETKNGDFIETIFNNETVKYTGGYKQESQWKYETNDEETFANPASLGETIKLTSAKVDKVNGQIELLAKDVNDQKDYLQENLARIDLDSKGINATVEQMKKDNKTQNDAVNESIGELTEKVSAAMTSTDVKLEISKALANGISSVETTTGFTFNEDGLTVSKSNNPISTQITENGMIITEDGDTVLQANNTGVDAKNLHATTYLIVGMNSRFEDYGTDRTGCFYVGGGIINGINRYL